MWELNAPLANLAELEALLDAGADTLYCGLAEPADEIELASMSRRHARAANLGSSDELAEAVRLCHERERRLFLAVNEHFYVAGDVGRFEARIALARDLGVDAVIVSNIAVLDVARRWFGSDGVIGSVGLTIQNSAAVRFFKELGVGRVIVPRHLSPSEIVDLAEANPDTELEVFALNDRCGNYDGLCSFSHQSLDGINYDVGCRAVRDPRAMRLRRRSCGVCSLYSFRDTANVRAAKVVGRDRRNLPLDLILKDLRFLRAGLDAIDEAADRMAYAELVRQLYEEVHGTDCGRDCYYVEDDAG